MTGQHDHIAASVMRMRGRATHYRALAEAMGGIRADVYRDIARLLDEEADAIRNGTAHQRKF